MAQTGMHFDGMKELQAFFETLPDHLSEKASDIVNKTADETARRTENGYPSEGENTGNLKKGVRVKRSQTVGHIATAKVESSSPHSHLYEEGSEMRKTHKGANRGRMPARPVLRRIAPQMRSQMLNELIEMVERETGVTITRGE